MGREEAGSTRRAGCSSWTRAAVPSVASRQVRAHSLRRCAVANTRGGPHSDGARVSPDARQALTVLVPDRPGLHCVRQPGLHRGNPDLGGTLRTRALAIRWERQRRGSSAACGRIHAAARGERAGSRGLLSPRLRPRPRRTDARRTSACGWSRGAAIFIRAILTEPGPPGGGSAESLLEAPWIAHDLVLPPHDVQHYNAMRPHRSLALDSPEGRSPVQRTPSQRVVSKPVLGGLHHEYRWAA